MSAGANVYEVTIQKSLNFEFWTNVYHLRADNLAGALSQAYQIIEDIEKPLHLEYVAFDSMRVRPQGTSDQGTTVPLNEVGEITGEAFLPLYNTLRVDFPVALGRPSRKFYRLPITETRQNNGLFQDSFLTFVQTTITGALDGSNGLQLCDVDGQAIIGAAPYKNVAMRQLRRGAKRRVITP